MADEKNKSGTRVITCTCKSDFQDQEYGKNKRLANVSGNGTHATCTVCDERKAI